MSVLLPFQRGSRPDVTQLSASTANQVSVEELYMAIVGGFGVMDTIGRLAGMTSMVAVALALAVEEASPPGP